MIDTKRQLSFPTANAWSIDLATLGGPRYVVLTTSEQHARERLAQHLADLGKEEAVGTDCRADPRTPTERVAVIW